MRLRILMTESGRSTFGVVGAGGCRGTGCARREAVRMTLRWERRVGAALVAQHRVPLEAHVFAAALLARTRLARWTRRVGIVALAAVTAVVVLLTIPVVVALVYLLNAL